MYKLAASEDLSFFLEIELLQVCVGRNEIILNFDNNIRLTILSDFSVGKPDSITERFEDPIEGATALLQFLHVAVTKADATPDGDLKLSFASGGTLWAHDTSSQYESFLVMAGSKEIIV